MTCPSCGSDQSIAAAFCSACGTPLAQEAEAVEDRQERRVVTVLFADLAGSTALGERLDPEDVRELQGELFDLINTEVERYGGTTEKFAGDAVLAVFGIPQAHEDDAERAVRTALAVRDAFGSFTERVAGSPRRRGRAPDRRQHRRGRRRPRGGRTRRADGQRRRRQRRGAPAAARRSPERCSSGSGRRPRRAAVVSYREREALEAKGKSEPVRAWVARVRRCRAGACRPRGVAGLTAPLVGRDEELAILTRGRRPASSASARRSS